MLLLDVEIRFDCAGSHKVSWRLLSASVSRGIYRRFLLLLDVEVRFDCAGSHILLDVEVRFDCAGSRKLDVFAFLAAPGTARVLSRGPAARVSGERSRARFPPCPRELVSLSLGMLGWRVCAATASRWCSEQQHPKNSNSESNSNSATIENKGRSYLAS